jgi:uncharacterized OB-fold protein
VFWGAATDGRLVAQRCGDCERFRHPPRPMCPSCHSLVHDVVTLAGLGTIYSYAVLHHPRSPLFTYPLMIVLVELHEGVRIVSNLVGVDPKDVRIGMQVRATFEPTADGHAVPVFVNIEDD